MMKGKHCETTISTPEKIIDKYYLIMEMLYFNINWAQFLHPC